MIDPRKANLHMIMSLRHPHRDQTTMLIDNAATPSPHLLRLNDLIYRIMTILSGSMQCKVNVKL